MNVLALLAFVFILGSAVILHEFGHFIVAKLLGIRVETFSVGFGKRLWGRRWGTTDYRLSLIPLGGYVKLGGDESNAGIEDGSAEDIPAGERFDLRPRWQKFLVGVAGPVMNMLTALAIPFVGAMTVGVPALTPVVSQVEQGGAAESAGLKQGDHIVSFDNENNPTWRWMNVVATVKRTQQLPIVVERGGERVALSIRPTVTQENGHEIGDLDFQPDLGVQPVVIDRFIEDSPAVKSGLKQGDHILALDGEPARNPSQVREYINKHPGQIHITVERQGERLELTTPEERLQGNTLGFYFKQPPLETVGPGEALSVAFNTNIEILRLTGMALGQVFTGKLAIGEAVGGPIAIAQASYEAANNYGWGGVFDMLGFLSLNLGIFNLLPIPVLDGGMIFILFLEGFLGLAGMKLSMRMRERIQQVGFVFLLLLMGFVIINDVTKFAPGWFRSKEKPAATQQK
ncbi:MAG: regulator of sigma protease [Acidobacteriota bacterium]|jgi:regulator of sigma E protease|nr:regulator of sigma protease [Acidobacteriota bacterium]